MQAIQESNEHILKAQEALEKFREEKEDAYQVAYVEAALANVKATQALAHATIALAKATAANHPMRGRVN